MQRYLLFDAGCLTCNSVAQAIETVADGWLVARSLSDQEIQKQLAQARPHWKWEPTLLEVEQSHIAVFTGLKLRLKLLRGLGPQKTWQTIQLVRQAIVPKDILNPRRRKLFVRSGAILGGLLLGIGIGPLAKVTYAQSEFSRDFSYSHLSPDAARHQLENSQTFQEATQRLGSPNWEQAYAYQSSDGGSKGVVIYYPTSTTGGQSITFLAINNPIAAPVTVGLLGSLTRKSSNHAELRWETPTGVPLATQVFQDGKSTVNLAPQSTDFNPHISPDFSLGCFGECLGKTVTLQCALNCLNCAVNFNFVACLVCGLCAGTAGVACAIDCNF